MNLIVTDTDVLIDYINGHALWVNTFLHSPASHRLILPTIVIAEFYTSDALEDKEKVQVADNTLAFFSKQDFTEEIAKIMGRILRRKTYQHTASTADLIVASTALYLNAQLATRNKKDFAKIPDLRFFDPKKYALL